MCAGSDKDGGQNTYGAYYRRNRTLAKDVTIKSANISYDRGVYRSGAFDISTDNDYHTKAAWSAVPSAPNDVSGFVATRYTIYACP
jgi:hypothetical protein